MHSTGIWDLYRKWCARPRLVRGGGVAVDVGDSEKISEGAVDHDSQTRLDATRRWIAVLERRLSNWNDEQFSARVRLARKLLYLGLNVLRGAASRCLLRVASLLSSPATALLKLRFGFLSLAFLIVSFCFSP